MELEEALANVDHEIHRAEEETERIQARIQALREERRGLELAIGRHGEAKAVVSSMTTDAWQAMNRSDATLRVLIEAREPMSPNEIVDALKERGRTDDEAPLISAALSYLARMNKVTRVGRGQWIAGTLAQGPSLAPLAAGAAVLGALALATKGGSAGGGGGGGG